MEKYNLYIDCTSTYLTGLNTGIQRVVRNIMTRAQANQEHFNFISRPVVIIDGEFYAFNFDVKAESGKGKTALPNQVKSTLEKLKNQAQDWPLVGPLARYFFVMLVVVGKYIYKILKKRRLSRLKASNTKIEKFDKTDCILFLDAFWDKNSISGVEKAKREAGAVITVIYDIIPITHPHFLEDVMIGIFTEGLWKVLRLSDGFLSISQSVMSKLLNYISQHKELSVAQGSQFSYFHLGADFEAIHGDLVVREEVKKVFTAGSVWLMVGTIEPRKNHLNVIAAFEKHIQDHPTDKLLILGWVGWKSDPILKGIISSKFFDKNIFMINNASDQELEYAYLHCKALIFASYTEGFGLPLVEAMQRNKLICCSDIGIFREIGADYPFYFKPEEPQSIYKAMLKVDEQRGPRSTQGAVMISWEESARNFFAEVSKSYYRIIEKKGIKLKIQSNKFRR